MMDATANGSKSLRMVSKTPGGMAAKAHPSATGGKRGSDRSGDHGIYVYCFCYLCLFYLFLF